MDPLTAEILEIEPADPRVVGLIEAHLSLMRASSPACSVHAMDAARLAEAGARFFAMFDDDTAIAMGALKRLKGAAGEVKSMHVRQHARGRGLADRILEHLLSVAVAEGLTRVFLETGSQPVFAPARAFYTRNGFEECPPFEGYVPDPNSVFMSRAL